MAPSPCRTLGTVRTPARISASLRPTPENLARRRRARDRKHGEALVRPAMRKPVPPPTDGAPESSHGHTASREASDYFRRHQSGTQLARRENPENLAASR